MGWEIGAHHRIKLPHKNTLNIIHSCTVAKIVWSCFDKIDEYLNL